MIKGRIFDIQHFCTDDGPGIRTVVFFKGCPLRCIWCHNPEGQCREKELRFLKDSCHMCGNCQEICKFHILGNGTHDIHRENCQLCGKCADACIYEALSLVGRDMTVAEILADVLKDLPFYRNSGGGITLSGGEPFAQPEFTIALLKKSKMADLNTCVETCLYCDFSFLEAAMPFVDTFLVDIKELDFKRHKEYTGVDNINILSNLRALDRKGASIILRCPLIPNLNASEDHILSISDLANSLKNVVEIDLEPYHPLGISKCESLGTVQKYNNFSFMKSEDVDFLAEILIKKTKVPVFIL